MYSVTLSSDLTHYLFYIDVKIFYVHYKIVYVASCWSSWTYIVCFPYEIKVM